MLRRVSVHGYQSLEDVDLELAPLTVIVGPSRSGKSALVRALRSAFFNATGAAFIRRGARAATVGLLFDDGTELSWEKVAGAGGVYVVSGDGKQSRRAIASSDGKQSQWATASSGGKHVERAIAGADVMISRVRELPPQLARLGVREIEIDGAKVRPQLDAQFEPPFLLAGSGGQAAKLLARVSRLDVLVGAQVLAHRDADRVRRDATSAEADAQRLAEAIAGQPDYEALLERWRALSERETVLLVTLQRCEEAWRLAERRAGLVKLAGRWQALELPARVAAARSRIAALVEAGRLVQQLDEQLRERQQLERRWEAAREAAYRVETELHGALAGLATCPLCGSSLKPGGVGNRVGGRAAGNRLDGRASD